MTTLLAQPRFTQATRSDRRAFPRRPTRAIVSYRPVGRPFGLAIRARAVDLSQGGIGLVVQQPLEPGALLEVELQPPGRGKKRVRTAEVRWAVAEPNGSYRVGCCWERRLTFFDLQELL